MNSTRLILNLFVFFIILGLSEGALPSIPSPPQYIIQGSFSIQYINLSIPITIIYDSINNRQYYDYYNGLDIYINLYNQNITYTIGPQVYHIGCQSSEEYGGQVEPILPTNVTEWNFDGIYYDGDVRLFNFKKEVELYGVVNTYIIGVTEEGSFYQYYIDGENTVVLTSHPDHYLLDVEYFSDNITSYEHLFNPPSYLSCDASQSSWSGNPGGEVSSRKVHDPHHIFHHGKTHEKKYQDHFTQFKEDHGKEYLDEEEHHIRYSTFKKRVHHIYKHNTNENSAFKLGMNHFGDMSYDEMRSMSGVKMDQSGEYHSEYHITKLSEDQLPPSVDWREKGCVSRIKDQSICGSCWAFGSIATLESQNCAINGELVELSEQQLIDCAYQQGSEGCNGGSSYGAYQYVQVNGGIDTESMYSYTSENGYCKINQMSSGVQVSGYIRIQNGSEYDLTEAVATVGPVVVAIDTHLGIDPDFYFYHSGVYSSPLCSSWNYDHSVSVIGYGTTQDTNEEYYLIKNSWSTKWGLDGFGLMARNKNNSCAIATDAIYPLVIPN